MLFISSACSGGLTSDSIDSSNSSSMEDSVSNEENIAQTVIITFKQNNQPDIQREIEKGGTLTDIPMPAPKTGYNVEWENHNLQKQC